jgi:hypothetical protein
MDKFHLVDEDFFIDFQVKGKQEIVNLFKANLANVEEKASRKSSMIDFPIEEKENKFQERQN